MPTPSRAFHYLLASAVAAALVATTATPTLGAARCPTAPVLRSAKLRRDARPATPVADPIRRSLLDAVRADQYAFVAAADGYQASNREHRLAVGVADGAVRLGPAGTGGKLGADGWTSEMRLVRYGHPGVMVETTAIATRAAGMQLEIEHPGLVEWYLNDVRGLEQGFTVATAPPAGVEGGPLTLELEVCGSLDAQKDGAAVRLTDRAAGVSFRYTGLVAWDATGRYLPAAMRLANGRLALEVDVADATYPVTVDPTIVNEDQKLTATDAGAGDFFGNAVAVDGDTAVVGAVENDDAGSSSGSAYVFVRSATVWSLQAKLTASDGAAGDRFGQSVAVAGDTAVIGAFGDDGSTGSAYVFVRSGTSWSQEAKLTASDAAGGDRFGQSVAVAGDTAVVGAYTDDDAGSASGAAYVFVRSGVVWSEQQKLTASDAAADDYFGISVSVNVDTTVVGARGDDASTGAAYVFVRSGIVWSEQAKLTASDAAASDLFGNAVSISGDTTVVGAFGDDASTGAAYVFVRSGITWSEQAKITASDAAAGDSFGWSIAIAADTAVVGAYDDDDAGSGSGAAYAFVRSGIVWSEQQKLTAGDAAAGDVFGYSVAVAGDTALVGADLDDDGGSNSGSGYAFTRSGVVWSEEAKITANDATDAANLGVAVGIDGDTAVVGGGYGEGGDTGWAYVFVRNAGIWSLQTKLTASDGAANDFFGRPVAIAGDTIVVGAHGDDDAGNQSGSAYAFVRTGTAWQEQQKLTASDAAAFDEFGTSVAVSGDTAVVGALFDDDAGNSSGSAYVFTRSGVVWSEQQKLTAGDAAADDRFGVAVAVDADTAVIGANFDDDAGSSSGSAYVFTRSGIVWSEQQKLTASDAATFDEFGIAVAVDADTALIGAYADESATGAAYAFTRSGVVWSEEQKLTASDAEVDDLFGLSVSVSGDLAVVGAVGDDDGGTDAGAAYAFVRTGAVWTEDVKLAASDAATTDDFGVAVAVDGTTAVIGADLDDLVGSDEGSVYVFHDVGVDPDTDGDGLTDADESDVYFTNPLDADTDDDGLVDGDEVSDYFTDPTNPDSDFDFVQDGTEVGEAIGHPTDTDSQVFIPDFDAGETTTDPLVADTDLGGVIDGEEDANQNGLVEGFECDPNAIGDDSGCLDSDFDGISDLDETTIYLTEPLDADTDDDGLGDGVEVFGSFTEPLGVDSDDDGIQDGTEAGVSEAGPDTDLGTFIPDADPGTTTDPSAADTDTGTASDGLEDPNRNGRFDGNECDPNDPADDLVCSGTGEDLVLSFNVIGTWKRMNNAVWQRLHQQSATVMATGDLDGNGMNDVIVGLQGVLGTWVWFNNATWVRIHERIPFAIAAGDFDGNGLDDLAVDFGPGMVLWAYMNNTSWSKLHSQRPLAMAVGNLDGIPGDEIIISIATGVWAKFNNTTWTRLHHLSASLLTVGNFDDEGVDDVAVKFTALTGLWVYYNQTTWTKQHLDTPERFTTGNLNGVAGDELIVGFGVGKGLWVLYDNITWTKLHTQNPVSLAAGDFDLSGADELVVDLGPRVRLWALYNNSSWVKLHNQQPAAMAIANIDGR